MQNRYRRTVVAFVIAAALLSCQKQETEDISGSVLTVSSDSGLPVRTQWNGQTIVWSEGDAVTLAYRHADGWKKALYESEPLSAKAPKAGFKVKVDIAPPLPFASRFRVFLFPMAWNTWASMLFRRATRL